MLTGNTLSHPPRTLIKPDVDEIQRALNLLCPENGIIEIRGLNVGKYKQTHSGYYDRAHLQDAAKDAARLSSFASGVYTPINVINPDLLARAANRIEEKPRSTTSDKDIVRRCKLLVDLDPERPTDVSSTDIEKEAARERSEAVRDYLADRGWVAPVVADSGNGYHLLYPIDLPNGGASLKLIEAVLKVLALQFGDDKVIVDIKVGNASRICKLYGTVSRKGDSTPDRPHRLSRILEDPGLRPGEIVTKERLEALAATLPQEPKPEHRNGKQSDFDLGQWVGAHNVPVHAAGTWNGGEKWLFDRGTDCPFGGGHDAQGCFIARLSSGAIAAGCHHNSCAGKGWADLRKAYEPDYDPNRKYDPNRNGRRANEEPAPAAGTDEEPELPTQYSDIALSNRLVERHGDDMRFIAGEWWVYNPAESRWMRDQLMRVFTWARRMCSEASMEAHDAAIANLDTPAKAASIANKIASAQTVAAVVSLTREHKKIPALLDVFDCDPWLLNTPGGVVNLKDNTTRPARRDDYFSKRTPVAPAKMPTPVFDQFLRDIMGEHIPPEVCQCGACLTSKGKPDDERLALHQQEVGELCAYLKRLYGYCLTADVRTHVLVIQVGEGGNGKGCLNDFVSQDILGTSPVGYSTEIPIEALLISKGDRHPTELMDLFHARLALARETGEDVRWNEGRVKRLSGGDIVKARRMRQDFVEFKPTHKPITFGNTYPELRGSDQAAWKRRLHLIPFQQKFDDPADPTKNIRLANTDLADNLRKEAPGVLQALIEGCLVYQRVKGLKPPLTVRMASEKYLLEQNVIARFVAEMCDRTDPLGQTTANELWAACQRWATSNKEDIGHRKDFNGKLERLGIRIVGKTHTERGVCKGIRLYEAEKAETEEKPWSY
ncbi:MAG: phage/plasmid primase, P4 family [Candidatus Binataceae bacterium]